MSPPQAYDRINRMWDRAFSYQTPLLWNQLTVWMWEMETLNALKIRLNTFPFDKRFSQVTLNGSIVKLLLAQTATGLCALQCITLSTSSSHSHITPNQLGWQLGWHGKWLLVHEPWCCWRFLLLKGSFSFLQSQSVLFIGGCLIAWVFSLILSGLYSIKCLEVTLALIWCYVK